MRRRVRRGANDTVRHRRSSLYKPSTYCQRIIFPGTQENKTADRESAISEVRQIVSRVIHQSDPLLFRLSQRVSWSGQPHLEPASASLHFISASSAPVARQSQNPTSGKMRITFSKKCPSPSHGWFLNRFTSSHETNQLIYLVKRSLIES